MPSVRPSQVNIDAGFAGQLAPDFPLETAASNGVTASRAYIARFVATKSRTITAIKFVLSASASANDNCDAGIFDATGTTLLGSAGSTAGKLNVAPGTQSLTLTTSVRLQQGTVYNAAWASGTQGGTAASVVMTNLVNTVTQIVGTTTGLVLVGVQASAFPLAAPFTAGAASGLVPILFLAE